MPTAGAVYITGGAFHGGSRRVRKFDELGTQLAEFWPSSVAEHGGAPYVGTSYNFTGGDTNSDESVVFVADPTNGCVWAFDASLNLTGSIGSGTFSASTNGPTDVCVVGNAMYVCQRANPVLTKWDFAGTLLASWATDLATPTALDVAPDDDSVFYVSSFNDVRKFVISTVTDSLVYTSTGNGGIRATDTRVYVGSFGTADVLDHAGTLIEQQFIDSGSGGIWGIALDPAVATDLWTVRQNTNNSPVHKIDLTQPGDVYPSYTTFQWNADAEGFRDGWLFMRRRNPTVNLGRPRMRGRHVPHAVRIRGRERGVSPDVPRMRGRQAS